MKKKLISTCLVLSICAVALTPVYKQLDLYSSNTPQSKTIWQDPDFEKILSTQQQVLTNDYNVKYPPDAENAISLTAIDENVSSNTGTAVKQPAAPAVAPAKPSSTGASSKKTEVKPSSGKTTAVKKTAVASKTSVSRTATKTKTATAAKATTKTSRGTTSAASSKAAGVINTAKSFMGVPYVWGGTTPGGFDCSGFIQYVLGKHGISVPRTAAEQYNVGTSVSKSNLRVGDLVFFTTYKPGPSHLGFYLGNQQFIHASSSKGVTISSLTSDYYASRYIGARRVIN